MIVKDKHLSFGEYIRKKRLADSRELTLQDVAEHLNVSASYVCAVENRTKRPFDGEMLERLAIFLNLSEEDTALMYDIAGRETHEVPFDIEDIFFHESFGDSVRHIIRLYQADVVTEQDLHEFIAKMEKRVKRKDAM